MDSNVVGIASFLYIIADLDKTVRDVKWVIVMGYGYWIYLMLGYKSDEISCGEDVGGIDGGFHSFEDVDTGLSYASWHELFS